MFEYEKFTLTFKHYRVDPDTGESCLIEAPLLVTAVYPHFPNCPASVVINDMIEQMRDKMLRMCD